METRLSRKFLRMATTRWKKSFYTSCFCMKKLLKYSVFCFLSKILCSCFSGSWFCLFSKSSQWVQNQMPCWICSLCHSLFWDSLIYSSYFDHFDNFILVDGSSGSDRYNSEPERKSKPVPRREAPSRPIQQSIPAFASASHSLQVSSLPWYKNVWLLRKNSKIKDL